MTTSAEAGKKVMQRYAKAIRNLADGPIGTTMPDFPKWGYILYSNIVNGRGNEYYADSELHTAFEQGRALGRREEAGQWWQAQDEEN